MFERALRDRARRAGAGRPVRRRAGLATWPATRWRRATMPGRSRCISARWRCSRRRVGAEHPDTAMVQIAAGAAVPAGRSARSRPKPMLRQALDGDREERWDRSIPGSCAAWSRMANLRDDAGDLEQAEEIDRRAHGDRRDASARPTTILYADLLNNLGDIYRQQAGLRRARRISSGARWPIGERLRGPGQLLRRHRAAEPRHRRARAQGLSRRPRRTTCAPWRSGSGRSGPIIPTSRQLLNNLANIYRATGDDDRSLDDALPRAAHLGEARRPVPARHAGVGRQHRQDLRGEGDIAQGHRVSAPRRRHHRNAAGAESGGRLGAAEAGVRQQRGGAHRSDDLAAPRARRRAIRTPARWPRSSCCSARGACSTR